jgi:mediator of DNA damage checkpoint protein 1
MSGNKTDRAQHWSIPIVNHTWLEDCFVRWKDITVGVEKYIKFPPGVDFSVILGEKGVGRKVLLQDAELDVPESSNSSAGMEVEAVMPLQSSANEVEEAVLIGENELDDDGDIVMQNNVDLGEEDMARKDDVSIKDRSMQTPTPPPPKKFIRRAMTKDKSDSAPADLDETSLPSEPASSKQKRNLKRSSGPSTKTRRSDEVVDVKKPASPGKAEEHDMSYSPSTRGKSTTSYDPTNVSALATSKGSTRRESSTTESSVGSESESDDTNDIRHAPRTRSAKKAVSTTVDEPGPAARRRSFRSSPLKLRVKESNDSTDDDTTVINTRSKNKTIRTPGKVQGNVLAKTPTISALDAPAQQGSSSRRVLSVVVPPPPDYMTPHRRKQQSIAKDPSLRIQAAEAIVQRDRPSLTNGKKKQARASDKSSESNDEGTGRDMPVAGPSKRIGSEVEAESRTRRSAASKATQKLRDVIMPDVMKFEKELKRGVVVGEWENKNKGKGKEASSKKRHSETGDEEERHERKRLRFDDNKAKPSKKRISSSKRVKTGRESDDESLDEVVESREERKRFKRRVPDRQDEDESDTVAPSSKGGRRKQQIPSFERCVISSHSTITRSLNCFFSEDDGATMLTTDPTRVRLMTTKVDLPSDTQKVFPLPVHCIS